MLLYTVERMLSSPASTPDQLTADKHNYDFAFTGTTAHVEPPDDLTFQRLSSDAARTITGIAAKGHAFVYLIANVGSFTITLANESSSSLAANRIITGTGANLDVGAGTMVLIVYDSTTARWRCHPTGSGSSGGVTVTDEGAGGGAATTIDFAGSGVSASVAGGVATVTIPGGGSLNPSTDSMIYEEFSGGSAATADTMGENGWNIQTANGGTATRAGIAASAGHWGVVVLSTSNSNPAGRAGIILTSGNALLGGGAISIEWLVNIETLSTAADEFDATIGFTNTATTTAPTEGVYFKYDRNTSTEWLRGVSVGGSPTEQATGITASAATWYRLRIDISADGSSATFTINGASAGSISSGLPTAGCAPTLVVLKSANTADSRRVFADYAFCSISWTTPR